MNNFKGNKLPVWKVQINDLLTLPMYSVLDNGNKYIKNINNEI